MQIRLINDKTVRSKRDDKLLLSKQPLRTTFQSKSLQLEETILQAPLFSHSEQLILGNGGDTQKPLLITLQQKPGEQSEPYAWIRFEEAISRVPKRFRLESPAYHSSAELSSSHATIVPNEEWLEKRNKQLKIKYTKEFSAYLAPSRAISSLILSYAIHPNGLVVLRRETLEDRNCTPVDFISIDLFFGEERGGQLDLAWTERYLVKKERLKQYVKREMKKEKEKR